MKEIQLTKGQVTLVDDDDFEWLNQWKWYACVKNYKNAPDQYYALRAFGRGQISMHREILKPPAEMNVDHIDGNGLNNQKLNLRQATVSQNGCNRGKQKDNTTGYKGVRFTGMKKRPFRADIKLHGHRFYLGTYATAIEAARAYNEGALRLHGEFAHLNDVLS